MVVVRARGIRICACLYARERTSVRGRCVSGLELVAARQIGDDVLCDNGFAGEDSAAAVFLALWYFASHCKDGAMVL